MGKLNIVLLSGGSGKRLWPLSNNTRSKQFLQLLESPKGTMESMVQRVVRQIGESGLDAEVTIATNEGQKNIIHDQLGKNVSMVFEPERRDTFPAIALSCLYLSLEKGCRRDEVVVVMPCDPYTEAGYFETIGRMACAVESDSADLVLMGIKPTYASPKFGYIVPEKGDGAPVRRVSRFTEKPDAAKAEGLLAEGAFWNGGVFAFRLGYVLDIVAKYLNPSTFADAVSAYGKLPKISFDYEVVEKAGDVAVVPFDGSWKDLGTWNSLTSELSRREIGNVVPGPECSNVHIINELGIPILVNGVNDVVVVASPDGILVCSKEDTENIKKYVETL